MKEYIEERAVAIANYIIDYNATVRQAARKFGISKSTVHKDVAERLSHINPPLASRAACSTGHQQSGTPYPGGMATKEKYEHEHQLRACSRTRNRQKLVHIEQKKGHSAWTGGVPFFLLHCKLFQNML
ncbi:MAG: sporulation transcriptional regulator SpoIIID [Clostridium fessum]